MTDELKQLILAQNRAEELLLDLITERLMQHKPDDELWDTERKEAEMRGEPFTDKEVSHYRGYCEGWWDAIDQLGNIILNHSDDNRTRLI